jgi:hypothetical protein
LLCWFVIQSTAESSAKAGSSRQGRCRRQAGPTESGSSQVEKERVFANDVVLVILSGFVALSV